VSRDTAVLRVGLMMSIPLFSHNPRALNVLEALCGIQMWRCGCSKKVNSQNFRNL